MTESVDRPVRTRLPALTSLRWYAALLVFAFHLRNAPNFSWPPLRPFGFGYVGVDFFFVLSGFVLTVSATGGARAGRFYWRRFARIYPAHLVMFVFVALAAVLYRPYGDGVIKGPVGVVTTLTLTQPWFADSPEAVPYNGPSWTLGAEAFFYLLFPLIASRLAKMSGRAMTVLVGGLLGATVVVDIALIVAMGDSGRQFVYFLPVLRLPEFVLGIGLALRLRTVPPSARAPRLWPPLVTCAVAGLISWRLLLPTYPLPALVCLPGFAWLIYAAARRDRSGAPSSVLGSPVSVYLGELSFAFYLVHVPIAALVLTATGWSTPMSLSSGLLPVLTVFLAVVAAAVVLHHVVEKPAQKMLLRWASLPGGPRRARGFRGAEPAQPAPSTGAASG